MIKSFSKIRSFSGELSFKGDKSISHRALIVSAMAKGDSVIKNLSAGDDVQSTINCLRDLGISIEKSHEDWIVSGNGFKGFCKPEKALYAGNSGTTARLLAGLLAAQDFPAEIKGDDSLSQRPMERIIIPLTQMGAIIDSNNGKLPLRITPAKELKPVDYQMIIPSAQVKSAVILAGLHCDKLSTIKEIIPTRDHTEIMLGLPVENNLISISKKYYPTAGEYYIPGDISSAVYFIILTLLTEGSSLVIRNLLLNKTRTGILSVLKEMGGSIEISNKKISAGEEYGDLLIKESRLKNIKIKTEMIPNIIDEIPALAIAGIFAEGPFEIRNAAELRKKETDRIRAIVDNLHHTNLIISEYEDGFSFTGSPGSEMPVFDSFGDHRIGMSFILLSLLLESGGSVIDSECVSISNPDFLIQVNTLR